MMGDAGGALFSRYSHGPIGVRAIDLMNCTKAYFSNSATSKFLARTQVDAALESHGSSGVLSDFKSGSVGRN